MVLTEEQKDGLGIALNEATLLGVEFNRHARIASVTFSVLSLPEKGSPPDDPRVQFVFSPVGRIAASLRNGRWDDPSAKVVPFRIEKLFDVVQSFDNLPIYGWKFFDLPEKDFQQWSNRLSIDYKSGSDGLAHSIMLFQEGTKRILDIRLWFDEFVIQNTQGKNVSIDDFIAGGTRWWDGLYKGDKRTMDQGIMPLKGKDTAAEIVNEINKKKR